MVNLFYFRDNDATINGLVYIGENPFNFDAVSGLLESFIMTDCVFCDNETLTLKLEEDIRYMNQFCQEQSQRTDKIIDENKLKKGVQIGLAYVGEKIHAKRQIESYSHLGMTMQNISDFITQHQIISFTSKHLKDQVNDSINPELGALILQQKVGRLELRTTDSDKSTFSHYCESSCLQHPYRREYHVSGPLNHCLSYLIDNFLRNRDCFFKLVDKINSGETHLSMHTEIQIGCESTPTNLSFDRNILFKIDGYNPSEHSLLFEYQQCFVSLNRRLQGLVYSCFLDIECKMCRLFMYIPQNIDEDGFKSLACKIESFVNSDNQQLYKYMCLKTMLKTNANYVEIQKIKQKLKNQKDQIKDKKDDKCVELKEVSQTSHLLGVVKYRTYGNESDAIQLLEQDTNDKKSCTIQ